MWIGSPCASLYLADKALLAFRFLLMKYCCKYFLQAYAVPNFRGHLFDDSGKTPIDMESNLPQVLLNGTDHVNVEAFLIGYDNVIVHAKNEGDKAAFCLSE